MDMDDTAQAGFAWVCTPNLAAGLPPLEHSAGRTGAWSPASTDKDQTKPDISCCGNVPSPSALSDSDSISGKLVMAQEAKDHAVFAMFCGDNSHPALPIGRADGAIAAIKGLVPKFIRANDHAVFARPCGPKLPWIFLAVAAIEYSSGAAYKLKVDHDQAVLARSCAFKAVHRAMDGFDIDDSIGL